MTEPTEFFRIIFGGVVGAIIGAISVHCLTTHRDTENKRKAFRAYIRCVICELEAMYFEDIVREGKPYFLYDWRKSFILSVRTEWARIFEDVPSKKKGEFDNLMMRFSNQGRRNVEPYETKTFEEDRQNLSEILKGMMQCTEWKSQTDG